MYPKIVFLLVSAFLIGAGVLSLRHERLEAAHQLAELQKQIHLSQRATWNLKSRLAVHEAPQAIAAWIEQAGLQPLRPEGTPVAPALLVDGAARSSP